LAARQYASINPSSLLESAFAIIASPDQSDTRSVEPTVGFRMVAAIRISIHQAHGKK
jgi:hypothetical protein